MKGSNEMSKPVHMLSRTRKPLVVAGAVLVVMAFSATSAQATTKAHKGAFAEVYTNRVQQICDTQTDGNGAYVTVRRSDGVEQNFWDGTGNDNECGGPFHVKRGTKIAMFKVCEHNEDCSDWLEPSVG